MSHTLGAVWSYLFALFADTALDYGVELELKEARRIQRLWRDDAVGLGDSTHQFKRTRSLDHYPQSKSG